MHWGEIKVIRIKRVFSLLFKMRLSIQHDAMDQIIFENDVLWSKYWQTQNLQSLDQLGRRQSRKDWPGSTHCLQNIAIALIRNASR